MKFLSCELIFLLPPAAAKKRKKRGVIIAAAKDPKTAQKWAVLYIKSQNGVVDWITDLLLYNGIKLVMNTIVF